MDKNKLKRFIVAIAIQAIVWMLIVPFLLGDFFDWPYSRFGIMASMFIFMNYIQIYGHNVKNYCIAFPFFYVVNTIICCIEKGFSVKVLMLAVLLTVVLFVVLYLLNALEIKIRNRCNNKK